MEKDIHRHTSYRVDESQLGPDVMKVKRKLSPANWWAWFVLLQCKFAL